MSRIENVKEFLDKNEDVGRFFTIKEDDPESGLLLFSSATVGKVKKTQRMFMRVREGQAFCILTAHVCDLANDEDYRRVLPELNRITAEYMGVRAYASENEADEESKYTVIMSIENFFGEDDDNADPLFLLDQILTRAVEKEYDTLMKCLYAQ